MDTFSVKNFEKFQHYKDRNPPWIRLYNALLDDYEYGLLPDASKSHLCAIWLLASRYDNKIPCDTEWISRRINATEPIDLTLLSEHGFILIDQDCSKVLADRKQSAVPEESRGEQSRGEESREEKNIPRPSKRRTIDYPDDFERLWVVYQDAGQSNSVKKTAFEKFDRLDPEDRGKCKYGLAKYLEWLYEEQKTFTTLKAKLLETFINKEAWEGFLDGYVSESDRESPVDPGRGCLGEAEGQVVGVGDGIVRPDAKGHNGGAPSQPQR